MGDFWTAGLDPVFWLHHCNIDRYWEVRGHDDDSERNVGERHLPLPGRQSVRSGRQRRWVRRYNRAARLPIRRHRRTDARPCRIRTDEEEHDGATTPPPDLPSEVVGTRGAVHLKGERVDAPLQIGGVSSQFRNARGGEAEPQRVYLTVDDITGDANPGISYAVYINDAVEENLAGLISFFGIQGTAKVRTPWRTRST